MSEIAVNFEGKRHAIPASLTSPLQIKQTWPNPQERVFDNLPLPLLRCLKICSNIDQMEIYNTNPEKQRKQGKCLFKYIPEKDLVDFML